MCVYLKRTGIILFAPAVRRPKGLEYEKFENKAPSLHIYPQSEPGRTQALNTDIPSTFIAGRVDLFNNPDNSST